MARQRSSRRTTIVGAAAFLIRLLLVSGLGGCAAVGGDGTANGGPAGNPVREALTVDPQVDHLKGDPEAPNVIIEYSNFLCHFCGMFFEESMPDVLELVDQGRAVYIYRHYAFTPGAETVAIAAECAAAQGQAFFFPYHDLIFENQQQVATSDDVAVDTLRQFAIDLGLDSEEFDACLANRTTQERVDRDYRSALALEVNGTPTFFVNGQKLEGVHAVEDFEALMLVE